MEMKGTEWALGAGGTSGALRPELEHGTGTERGATAQLGGVYLEPRLAVGNCSMNINGQVLQDAAGPRRQLAGAWEGRGKVAPPGFPVRSVCSANASSAAAPAGRAERCLHGGHASSVPSQQRRTPPEQLRSGHASGTPRSPRNVAQPHPEAAKFPARRASEMPG